MTFSYVNLGATRNVNVCKSSKEELGGVEGEDQFHLCCVVLISKSVLLPTQGGTAFWFFEQLMLVIKDFLQNQLS